MSTIEIIFFSPRGSTRILATSLSQTTLTHDLTYPTIVSSKPMDQELDRIKCLTLAPIISAKKLIIACPIYENHIPKLFISRLKTLNLRDKEIVLLLTYGGVTKGNAPFEGISLLSSLGGKPMGVITVKTPHCYLPSKPYCPTPMELEKIWKEIATTFDHGKLPNYKKTNPLFPRFINKNRHWLFPLPTTIKENCSSCKTCQTQCPAEAISDTLITQANCILCGGCVEICPVKARIFSPHLSVKIGLRLATSMNKFSAD